MAAANKALEILESSDATKNEEQNLIVALRIRPMNEDEIIEGSTPIAHKVDKNMVVLMDPMDDQSDILRVNRSREKKYMFDFAFDGTTVQEEVYEHTSEFLIENVMRGYNATVFAYGATGTGKTYTMLGRPDEPGLMARALNDLFLAVDRTHNMKHEITMSYLEIYNEMIRDLLNPASGYLDLREDTKGVQVAGLTTLSTRNLEQFMEILQRGNKERTQEPTAANKTSSRSHAVLQLTVRQKNSHVTGTTHEVRMGKLFLIDLAGSERAAKTHNKGKRMVEGAHINRSLLALGNCINALSDKSGSRYVNYRDSKLTRLLKDALGGNCRTVMIAHISPASIHFEESRNTLVYADRAKRIKTKVRKNVLDVSYHISQYVHLINDLVQENRRLRGRLDDQGTQNPNSSALQAIQSEILHSGTRHGVSTLGSIKEELLNIFKDQMEFRHSLMDLNNTAMQISIEKTRNQLLIKKWEREKPIRRRGEQLNSDKWSKSNDTASTDLVSIEDSSEPNDVTAARDELLSLDQEQEQTDTLRLSVQKELHAAKEKAARVQELLPNYVTTADHQEIVSLLIKVHELEIEKLEMQSSCMQRSYELQRREFVIGMQNEHRALCQKIIEKQKGLIDQHMITYPKELEELYTLYLQELNSNVLKDSNFLPPLPSYKTPSLTSLEMSRLGGDQDGSTTTTDKLSAVEEARKTAFSLPAAGQPILQRQNSKTKEKIFSHSPKAQQLRQSLNMTNPTTLAAQNVRQKSVVTLSSHSDSPAPKQPAKIIPTRNTNTTNNKVLIQTNTRNIAALAAQKKRKSKASIDNNNNNKSSLLDDKIANGDNYLSASRLAVHNTRYPLGTDMTLRQLLGEELASGSLGGVGEEPLALKQGQVRHKGTTKKNATGSYQPKLKYNGSVYEGNHSYQLTPEEFFKQLSKTTPRRGGLEQASYSSMVEPRPLYRNKSRSSQHQKGHSLNNHADNVFDDDMRHLEMAPTPNSSTMHQNGLYKNKGLNVHKKMKETSQSNTPQPNYTGHHKNGNPRKGASGIPTSQIKMRDMNITGYAIQR